MLALIKFIHQLAENGQDEDAVSYAERVIAEGNLDRYTLMKLYCILLTSYYYLGRDEAALAAGEVALKLSQELGSWEDYAAACIDLGAVHYRLSNFEMALNVWLSYLSRVHLYEESPRREATVWYNIWRVYSTLGHPLEASKALERALAAADRTNSLRTANGIRNALISAFIESGNFEPLPALFAKCSRYLRNDAGSQMSRLWLTKLRVEYLIRTNRTERGKALASRGLGLASGYPRFLCAFHLLLAEIAVLELDWLRAYQHGLAARTYAIDSGRSDLQSRAEEVVYQAVNSCPEVPRLSDMSLVS